MKVLIIALGLISMAAFSRNEVKEIKDVENIKTVQKEQKEAAHQADHLYGRRNNTMLENARNPAMVKGFQRVGSGKQ